MESCWKNNRVDLHLSGQRRPYEFPFSQVVRACNLTLITYFDYDFLRRGGVKSYQNTQECS